MEEPAFRGRLDISGTARWTQAEIAAMLAVSAWGPTHRCREWTFWDIHDPDKAIAIRLHDEPQVSVKRG